MYTYAISLRVNILNKIVIKHQLSYMIDLNVWLTEKSIASHIKKKRSCMKHNYIHVSTLSVNYADLSV